MKITTRIAALGLILAAGMLTGCCHDSCDESAMNAESGKMKAKGESCCTGEAQAKAKAETCCEGEAKAKAKSEGCCEGEAKAKSAGGCCTDKAK